MKITQSQLIEIIKEEHTKLLKEGHDYVPEEYIQQLTQAMTNIVDWVESVSSPENQQWLPEDAPLKALEVIEGEVASFKEYLGSGYMTESSEEPDELDADQIASLEEPIDATADMSDDQVNRLAMMLAAQAESWDDGEDW